MAWKEVARTKTKAAAIKVANKYYNKGYSTKVQASGIAFAKGIGLDLAGRKITTEYIVRVNKE